MRTEIDTGWRLIDGRLCWPSGTPVVRPSHQRVPVGAHLKGYNKTIGKMPDGAKKRWWLGKDKREAERKAAKILNVWEWTVQLAQENGLEPAWSDEQIRGMGRAANIDSLTELDKSLKALEGSVATDLSVVRLGNGGARLPASPRTDDLSAAEVPTLHGAIDAYEAVIKTANKSESYLRRQLEVLKDLKRFRDDCPLTSVDRACLEELTNYIKSRPLSRKTKRPIAADTARTYLQYWRVFFKWIDNNSESAKFGGWEAPKNWGELFAVDNIRRTKAETDRLADGPEQIEISEIAALLDHAGDDRQRMLILLALFAAQGQTELSVTQRKEFDLKAATFTHRRNKTGVRGVYWLPPELVKLLSTHFAKSKPEGDDLAFLTREGKPLVTKTSDSIRQWFDGCRERAEVRDCISFYSLRTYFGHRAAKMGGDEALNAALAHSAKTVARKNYTGFRDFGKVAEVGKAIHADLLAAGAFGG
jgi:hypothetical protein